MQKSLKIQKLSKVILAIQPIIYIAAILAGSLNNNEDGFNGMQAVFVIPIFLIIFVCYLIWKKVRNRFIAQGNASSAKLADRLILTLYVLTIIIDLGILISTFLTAYYINLFSFPPTITKY